MPRKAVYLRATIYPIDVFADARIQDLSATGARGRADVELAIGQTLHLTLDERSYHTGQVKWTRNRNFGFAVPHAAAIFGILPADMDHGSVEGHRPRSPRIKVDIAARLVGGRPPQPAIIRNISASGILLNTSPGISPGQHLVVQVDDAPTLYGRVQWSDAGRIGLKTQQTLSETILARQQAAP
ncbi:PilZ domain-containing protein [Sphingomonas hylomeconis]|uniref:PilZ domain-containing protein n=1 Tax=Sphingomonas hylomeconis TaxID=1395958 RepID=A0ABV7SUD3_9SPHN|nr:PilZ domain-containing protein [Sphingomonas hylomeconis]